MQIPSSPSHQEGKNFEDVVIEFQESGFTNIKTEPIEDLILGWLTEDGEVEEVSVGGSIDYSANEWVDSDTPVIIRYHTFPLNAESLKDVSSSNTSQTAHDNNITETNAQTLLYHGVQFSFPTYYNIHETLEDGNLLYYPEREDYYSSLYFEFLPLDLDQDAFVANRAQGAEESMKNLGDITIIYSRATTVAGFPAWQYSLINTDDDYTLNFSSIYIPNERSIVLCFQFIEDRDQSNYNYAKDFETMLETAIAIDTDSDIEDLSDDGPQVFTVENCEELAEILTLKDPMDSKIESFARRYKGEIIEFDGNTAYVSHHGSYNTRFDFLIYAGDYSETSVSGPSFQFSDVSYHDLHLTGSNVPDAFGIGLNIHVIARVEDYNSFNGLFQLTPISITMR